MYFLVLLHCAHEVDADDDNEKRITRAKMFLQTNRTQAAEIVLVLQTCASEGPNTSSV